MDEVCLSDDICPTVAEEKSFAALSLSMLLKMARLVLSHKYLHKERDTFPHIGDAEED